MMPEITYEATETYPPPLSTGKIYMNEELEYGVLEPVGVMQLNSHAVIPAQRSVPYPDVFQMAFSYYSDQVAYAGEAEVFELWAGDVGLVEVKNIWRDENNWLGYNSKTHHVRVRWGPGDQTLFLENDEKWVVVGVKSGKAYQIQAFCDLVGNSPKTGRWAIWCPVDQRDTHEGNRFLVIEQNGDIWEQSINSLENLIKSQDWLLSPDGSRLLYVDLEGRLWIADRSDKHLGLPINFIYNNPNSNSFIPMRPLRWSLDGRKVLVYVTDTTGRNAPKDRIQWAVLDAISGKLVWSPQGEAKEAISDAAISPDGNWIVLFIKPIPMRYTLLVSLITGESYQISHYVSDMVHWAK